MSRYKHLLAFDLSSYGAALALVQQFADDQAIKIFEISPVGTAAQLILLGEEIRSLEFVQHEAQTLFSHQILASAVIADVHPQLLPVYLSQNSVTLQRSLAVLEGESVAEGLRAAQTILESGVGLVDFRIVRTFPKNVILTVTSDEMPVLTAIAVPGFRKTCIERAHPPLRELFEIVQKR